ncbi:hypothetical protein VM95_11765 [Streptomyces rubellomurinus]|uniref:Uncharacterized protein n=1 Tax=Streptomyces rubellomurinus (strain ATCC 31215) TaxID=359131 RepID=A0A0F2TFS3_STRR3|nr:hypothetical protein VM95_11765 [Streptomyces rubellomurinus]
MSAGAAAGTATAWLAGASTTAQVTATALAAARIRMLIMTATLAAHHRRGAARHPFEGVSAASVDSARRPGAVKGRSGARQHVQERDHDRGLFLLVAIVGTDVVCVRPCGVVAG